MTAGCLVGADTLTRMVSTVDNAWALLFTVLLESRGPGAWLFPCHPGTLCLGPVVLSLPSTVLVPLVLKDELSCCPLTL